MNLTVPQAPERSSPVILSAAKDLAAGRERPFAALRVTRCDCSNGQEPFVQIEPCLRKETRFHAAKGVGSGPRVKSSFQYPLLPVDVPQQAYLASPAFVEISL